MVEMEHERRKYLESPKTEWIALTDASSDNWFATKEFATDDR